MGGASRRPLAPLGTPSHLAGPSSHLSAIAIWINSGDATWGSGCDGRVTGLDPCVRTPLVIQIAITLHDLSNLAAASA